MPEEARHPYEPESDERSKDKEQRRKHHRKTNVNFAGTLSWSLWCIGWLFTIGFLKLPFFWKGVLALIIWPYYLGRFFAP